MPITQIDHNVVNIVRFQELLHKGGRAALDFTRRDGIAELLQSRKLTLAYSRQFEADLKYGNPSAAPPKLAQEAGPPEGNDTDGRHERPEDGTDYIDRHDSRFFCIADALSAGPG